MRHFIFMCLVVASLLSACNNNKKNSAITVTSDDGKEKVTVDANQMQNAAEAMQKQAEELQKLQPLSLDQLKAFLPEELMGAKRSNYQVTSATGAGLAHAKYNINNSTEIKVSIWDCGGPAGAGIYNLQYMGMLNYQSETEDEYTKTIDFMGQKAFEHCDKTDNNCAFTYFTGGRFLVSLEGDNVGADALKQAAESLNVK
jgi:hypothetical protein